MRGAFAQRMAERRMLLGQLDQLRRSLGHESVLARGFALVRDERDRLVRRAGDVVAGERLTLQFADGTVRARAEEGEPAPTAPPPSRPKRPKDKGAGGQGSLF
jgi:exodeoxyribonuclease VII large subunit